MWSLNGSQSLSYEQMNAQLNSSTPLALTEKYIVPSITLQQSQALIKGYVPIIQLFSICLCTHQCFLFTAL